MVLVNGSDQSLKMFRQPQFCFLVLFMHLIVTYLFLCENIPPKVHLSEKKVENSTRYEMSAYEMLARDVQEIPKTCSLLLGYSTEVPNKSLLLKTA